MKCFPNIYSERDQDAGWNVVQAATLLHEAKARRCTSLVIYAALELRLAIEQLIFTIIVVAEKKVDEETLKECRKKDGLFRVLDEVAPKYTLRCLFCGVMCSFYPELPQPAEWDVRSMKRFYTALSELCHSQLLVHGMDAVPGKWDQKIELLEEVYEFLAAGLRRGTGLLTFTSASEHVVDLWDKYSKGEITLDQVRGRFELIKPVLDARRIQK
jgi:hypothetical protein